ncbi:hypothetical protein [Patulibacter minatonensis]|uniref:hypothetical protein n=1 Tax=Patulibacter minatonensis TaxID=298163 RepID=UPI00047876F5|nr:hypothetical protein [Patulibacter minatonensis]
MRPPCARRPLPAPRDGGRRSRRSGLVAGSLTLGLAIAGVAAPQASARAVLSADNDPVQLGPFNPDHASVGTLVLRNTSDGGGERLNISAFPESPLRFTDCNSQGGTQIEIDQTRNCTIAVTGTGLAEGASFERDARIDSVTAGVGSGIQPRNSITVTVRGTIDRLPPPVPTFSQQPTANTTDTTPAFAWSSPGAARYECRLDDVDVACGTSYTTATLQTGSHTFEVRALDAADNPSSYRTATFRVLKPGPGVPDLDVTSIDFGLRRTTGGPRVVTVFNEGSEDLRIGSPSVGAPFGLTDTCPTDLPAGDTCTVTFRYAGPPSGTQAGSVDLAPNAAGGDVSLAVDGRSPVVAPTLGDPTAPSETSRTFAFAGTEPDVKRLECSIDSTTVYTTCTSPTTRGPLADGDHTFRVRQVTVDDVTSPVASRTFRVARVPVVATSPTLTPDDPSRRAGSRFSVAGGTFTGTTPLSTAITWERCQGGSCTTIPDASGDTYSATPDDVGFGLRAVRTGTNEAGSTASPTSTTDAIRPPLEAPDVAGPVAGETNATQRFTWDGTEADVARFECSDDGATFATCTSPTTLTGLPDGDRTFAVRQVAADGVVSPARTVDYRVAFPVRSTAPPVITPENASRNPGSRFTVTPGAYEGTATIAVTEQWERCTAAGCVPVTGATGPTYTTSSDDVGATLRVVETATNELGPLRTTTAETDPIVAVPVPGPTVGPAGGTTELPSPGALPLGRISASGIGARLTLTTTVPGGGTIEAVATHTRPSNRALPRAKSVLVPGRGRFVYARQAPTKVQAGGRVTLRLVRTAEGRRARFASKTIALRVVVHFTRDGGRTARSVRTVRVRIRR